MKRLFALALVLALLAGCAGGDLAEKEPAPEPDQSGNRDLMQGVAAHAPETDGALTEQGAATLTDFGVRLLQGCLEEGGNALVSPLSVMEALGMTANGAAGDTLAQMEQVLGFAAGELNDALYIYTQGLPDGEGGSVRLANGIWLREGAVEPEEAFLQDNADYYGAGVFAVPFDGSTAADINAFVAANTKGRIDRIVDEIPAGAMLYLVNALSFDGTWEDIYREDQVDDGIFVTESREERPVQMMYSTEFAYLEDEQAKGFVKYYEGRDYAFAALLPEEGLSLAEYVSGLTGERLSRVLGAVRADVPVFAAIPKFTAEYAGELSQALTDMGMGDLFDPSKADLSAMGTCSAGPLYVSQVLHKTYLAVDEQGTQAGAATAVEVEAGAAMQYETITLDRPFVYMILDAKTNVPIFIGAMTDPA